MKLLVVFALAIASAATELISSDDEYVHVCELGERISHGQTAATAQFPYQVGLNFRNNNDYYWWCGGSIIGTSWVLTVAHCTTRALVVTIYFGATVHTRAKLTQTISSSNFIQHASYNSVALANDISLIRTNALTFTSYINKVELPSFSSSYSTYAGQQAVASGWGKTLDSGTSVAEQLQYSTFQVVSVATCQRTYGSLIATSKVICVATPNRVSTCYGDSGGPLVLSSNKKLIGISSFVSKKGCEVGAPAAFTRVTSYLNWIKENSGVSYGSNGALTINQFAQPFFLALNFILLLFLHRTYLYFKPECDKE